MEAKTQTPTPTLEESMIVERVARILSSVRGAKSDYSHLAAELEPAIPFDVLGVVLLRHDRQAVRVTMCQHQAEGWASNYRQHPLQGSMVERMLHSPEAIVANFAFGLDGPPAICGDALSGCHHLRATYIAPLIAGDKVLGTFELGSSRFGAYAEETLRRLIGAVVQVLAAAIESAQVGGSAEIQDRQRRALKSVSNALTSKMNLPTILNQIVEGIALSLNVAAAIVTYDAQNIRLEAQQGVDVVGLEEIVSRTAALSDQAIIGCTLRDRIPYNSDDIAKDERFPASRAFATLLGIHSIACYPLTTGATSYGALLLFSQESGGFTPLKSEILALFASQATIAIHNGMVIESINQRSRFQQAIEQLEQAHERNLENEQVLLSMIYQESERIFGVSFSSLLHFISNHLLTRSERDLHTLLYEAQQDVSSASSPQQLLRHPPGSVEIAALEKAQMAPRAFSLEDRTALSATSLLQEDSVAFLTETAEGALEHDVEWNEVGNMLNQLKQSVGHIKDGWVVVDLDGHCLYMDPAAEVFCGLHMSTALRRTLEDIFSDILVRIRNNDAMHLYLQDFAEGCVNQRVLRCVLAVEPIDDQASQALQESNPTDRHLQFTRHALSHARSHAYSREQHTCVANVLQIRDITEEVRDQQNKSTLLQSVSHDFRTPLTVIKAGVTGLLQVDIPWNEQLWRVVLEEVDSEADRLTTMVDEFIEMSRLEMGALVLDKKWCDIVEILDGALVNLEKALEGRRVSLDVPTHLPLIEVDHVQMERVFSYLLENAALRSPADAEIVVSFRMVDEHVGESSSPALRVTIIDHGLGVSAEEREQLFFKVRGSGVGLAICRGIIEAHQGAIGLGAGADGETSPERDDGVGFYFTIPLHSPGGVLPSAAKTFASTFDQKPDAASSSFQKSSTDVPSNEPNGQNGIGSEECR